MNDAVSTHAYNMPRGIPIIPKYDALDDPGSRAYFRSPVAISALELTLGNSSFDDGVTGSRTSSPLSSPDKVSQENGIFIYEHTCIQNWFWFFNCTDLWEMIFYWFFNFTDLWEMIFLISIMIIIDRSENAMGALKIL